MEDIAKTNFLRNVKIPCEDFDWRFDLKNPSLRSGCRAFKAKKPPSKIVFAYPCNIITYGKRYAVNECLATNIRLRK
jgi:hypothetical protein